jgi:hypothetical protein
MAPLIEALFIFVGVPAALLATIAAVVSGAVTLVSRLSAPEIAPAARPARVVAFPGARTTVIRSAEGEDLRRVA